MKRLSPFACCLGGRWIVVVLPFSHRSPSCSSRPDSLLNSTMQRPDQARCPIHHTKCTYRLCASTNDPSEKPKTIEKVTDVRLDIQSMCCYNVLPRPSLYNRNSPFPVKGPFFSSFLICLGMSINGPCDGIVGRRWTGCCCCCCCPCRAKRWGLSVKLCIIISLQIPPRYSESITYLGIVYSRHELVPYTFVHRKDVRPIVPLVERCFRLHCRCQLRQTAFPLMFR